MNLDKTDMTAIGSLLTAFGSGMAQINNVALEYLPLITAFGAVTAAVALVVKVWSVKATIRNDIRNRALEHKKMEHGRRVTDE